MPVGVLSLRCLISAHLSHDLPELHPDITAFMIGCLRDSSQDMTLKSAVVEESIRLLVWSQCGISGPMVSHFIAALLLQYFERPDSE